MTNNNNDDKNIDDINDETGWGMGLSPSLPPGPQEQHHVTAMTAISGGHKGGREIFHDHTCHTMTHLHMAGVEIVISQDPEWQV